MTGEINLQGNILPIGGVKEKILAAKQNKIANVLLPTKNKQDILGIEKLIEGIKIIWVEHAQEVLNYVLLDKHHVAQPIANTVAVPLSELDIQDKIVAKDIR